MVKLLNNSERAPLSDIFSAEFDSVLPDESQANVVAVVEDEEIKAFVTSEVLIRAGLLYVKPEIRNTPLSARYARELTRYLIRSIPRGSSVIAIASDPRFNSLYTRLGMREEGTAFRIDL